MVWRCAKGEAFAASYGVDAQSLFFSFRFRLVALYDRPNRRKENPHHAPRTQD